MGKPLGGRYNSFLTGRPLHNSPPSQYDDEACWQSDHSLLCFAKGLAQCPAPLSISMAHRVLAKPRLSTPCTIALLFRICIVQSITLNRCSRTGNSSEE